MATETRARVTDAMVTAHARMAAGIPYYECSDGWFWIAASQGVLDPMTDAEVACVQEARGVLESLAVLWGW